MQSRFAIVGSSPKRSRKSCCDRSSTVPILIGGQGEKKTFRLVAQYADELNINANFADLPRKLDALQGHLDARGRDRSDITVTSLGTVVVGGTHHVAVDKLKALINAHGFTPTRWSPTRRARQLLGRFIWGDPDEVIAGVRELVALGLDGIVFDMVAEADDIEAIALAGETLIIPLA